MASGAVRGAGEEVFETPDLAEDDQIESEGLDVGLKTANKVPDAEVVSTLVPPQAAFEVFMGRTYAGAREDMSDIIGASSTGVEGAVYTGEGYHRDGDAAGVDEGGAEGVGRPEAAHVLSDGGRLRRTGESPVQRLARLREETAMLAQDLEEMSKAKRKGGENAATDGGTPAAGDEGGYALWSAMAKETELLKRQLALLSGDPRYKHILSSTARTAEGEVALQERLSEGVVKALENLREAGATETKFAEDATPAAGGGEGTGSVTYELFLKEASEARRRVDKGMVDGISEVETRIAALEKALGGGRDAAGVGFGEKGEARPLADAVASLEKRVFILEPGRLDGVRQKAQLAKAELDSLAKSRAALSGSPSGKGGSAAQSKKVEEAFATLQTWQGVAAGLPALVDRLRALESLHLASASFAQRLEQMELSQTELVGVLKSTNEGLEATRASATDNVAIVNENIRALDHRLAGVGWS